MPSTANHAAVKSPSDGRLRMRWPIRLQLLLPMMSVVLVAACLATGITACCIASRVRTEQGDELHRAAATLAEATFPLTERVLIQMRGLSGAEFSIVGPEGRLQEATFRIREPWIQDLVRIRDSRRAVAGVRHSVVSWDNREYLVDFVSVSRRSQFAGPATLFILFPEDRLAARIRQAVFPALAAGAAAAVVAAAITAWLARRFATPIHRLVAHTAEISRGQFLPMPVPRRNDEFRDLAESINHMTDQLASYEHQIRRHERLSSLGRLGAAMAHQLRNAATGGRIAIELHRRDCPSGSPDESLDVALRQLQLMESYLRQFLWIGGTAPTVRERIDAVLLVDEVLGVFRPSSDHAGVRLQFNRPAQPFVLQGNPEALRQLITNLVLNALNAASTNSGAPPRVVVDIALDQDGLASLWVQDSGLGPPASVRDRLFESFVTTKPDGVGLGLFCARQIAESHGGRLRWERRNDMTCFVFEFPLGECDHGARSDCR